jgi:hypothetical protein
MVGSTISNPRRPGPLTTNLRCNQLSSRADVSSLKYGEPGRICRGLTSWPQVLRNVL